MSKDARAKAIAAALDIRYAHAFRLMREFLATIDRQITKDEVVSTVVARYRDRPKKEETPHEA